MQCELGDSTGQAGDASNHPIEMNLFFMKPTSGQSGASQKSGRIRALALAVLCLTVSCGAQTARAFTAADADAIFDAHTKAFYA